MSQWSQEEISTLFRLLAEGKALSDIAGALNKSYNAVNHYVWRRSGKIPERPRKKSRPRGYLRRCHDCGAPTTDYRCPACWAKLRRKGGYNLSDTVQDVETRRSTLYPDGSRV